MNDAAGSWNPDTYLWFERQRTLPATDLAARIEVAQPERVIDIGCGPGNSTAVLRRKWPHAAVTGLDSSEEMIRKARAQYPDTDWVHGDARAWTPDQSYHVIFSNAALQWMPDQQGIIRKLFAALVPGGALAVQVPADVDTPLRRAVMTIADRAQWRTRMSGCASLITYRDASFYYDILSALSQRLELWTTTYTHVLDSHQELIDWYTSTGMKTYLARIQAEEEKTAFKRQVLDECRPGYPQHPDGRILFPFPRLFFVVYRPE